MREQQPWPEVVLLAYQHAALWQATPYERPAVLVRMNRHDTRRGIPPPEPLGLNRERRSHENADDDIPKGISAARGVGDRRVG